jgi:quercetin dioxygenase-like cupin family protein
MPATKYLDLAAEVEVPEDGTLSRVLFEAEHLRLVVFAFDAGQELTDHTAARPAVIQVVSGRLLVTLDGDPAEMGPGSWVHMPAHLSHAVQALEPSVMALTLLKAG